MHMKGVGIISRPALGLLPGAAQPDAGWRFRSTHHSFITLKDIFPESIIDHTLAGAVISFSAHAAWLCCGFHPCSCPVGLSQEQGVRRGGLGALQVALMTLYPILPSRLSEYIQWEHGIAGHLASEKPLTIQQDALV